MGLLQSCQNPDPRMSVCIDNNLMHRSITTNFSSNNFYYQQSKLKLFGDIFHKKLNNKTQFILQTYFVHRNAEVISHSLRIFQDSGSFMHEIGQNIKIISPINDPNIIGSNIYTIRIGNKGSQLIMQLIPFNRYDDNKFKQGIYEISMLHSNLSNEQNNPYNYQYKDTFVVESGIDKDKNDKCLVILGERANATLYQILCYRQIMKRPWSEQQYHILCYQLMNGLVQIHRKNIAHRDIRPHNIYYCPSKKSYVIGKMHNSIILNNKNGHVRYNLSGVPYYLPKYLVKKASNQDYSQYYSYNPKQLDIYSLGVTLMNCLFLDVFAPIELLLRSMDKYNKKYTFLNTLKNMIDGQNINLSQIISNLPIENTKLQQNINIDSMRYKMKPQDQQFVNRKKLISNGYYQLFMYDQWVEQINQVINYYQLNHNKLELAQAYKSIADIYNQHHQQNMMIEYYGKASQIYLKISIECMEDNKNQQAIQYLEKGIDCNRKGYNGAPNKDLAHLLNKLAMINHLKAQYEIARAFQEQALQIIAKVKGQNSPDYALMLVDSAKIESEFQQFKQAENMLKAGLRIMDKIQQTNENSLIKAKLLQILGSNYRMKAIDRRQKCEVFRKKAQQCLLDSLDIAESIQGNIHPQVGNILLNLGNVYFDKRQFDKAKKSYQKALVVKQHTLKGRSNIEVGQCLTYLGNSEKFLKNYDKSIKHYDEAIEVFRKAYGNDHNQNTAVAIGNLGLVYKQLGQPKQEKQYLSLAKNILYDLYGENCPDYQYFHRQLGTN